MRQEAEKPIKLMYVCRPVPIRTYAVDGLSIQVCENVYEPSDDSFLALEAVSEIGSRGPGAKTCIDIGTGTGILGLYCVKRMDTPYVLLIDINPCALYCAKNNALLNKLIVRTDLVQCDNLSCLRRPIRRSIVVYNTPYLPVEERDLLGLAWSGGLREAQRLVSQIVDADPNDLCIVLVYSSLSGDDSSVLSRLKSSGFNISVKKVHFFFEDIKAVIACREQG